MACRTRCAMVEVPQPMVRAAEEVDAGDDDEMIVDESHAHGCDRDGNTGSRDCRANDAIASAACESPTDAEKRKKRKGEKEVRGGRREESSSSTGVGSVEERLEEGGEGDSGCGTECNSCGHPPVAEQAVRDLTSPTTQTNARTDEQADDDAVFDEREVCPEVVPSISGSHADLVQMPDVEENVCAICLEEFTDDDPAKTTYCGHKFHIQCIMQWRSRKDECPYCSRKIRFLDEDAQELYESVEPSTISLSRRTSSELANAGGDALPVTEEELYNSSMEILLRMMNQHPSTRATQSLERALHETMMRDDYRHSSMRQHRSRRRSASAEDADATAESTRRRGGGTGPRSRNRSHSNPDGDRAAAQNSSRGRARSGSSDGVAPSTLRSRWQAASSRARESLLRASQEIRARIRGKQQQEEEHQRQQESGGNDKEEKNKVSNGGASSLDEVLETASTA